MATTIEDLCDKGIHEVIEFIGMQEAGQTEFAMGNCYYCHSTVHIGEEYRHISGVVYELKRTEDLQE